LNGPKWEKQEELSGIIDKKQTRHESCINPKAMPYKKICLDLEAQYQELDDLVAELDNKKWSLETPFFHWTIFDEVAHIAFFDHESLLAIEEPIRFKERAKKVMKIIRSEDNWPKRFNPMLGPKEPDELLSHWRDIRTRLLQRLKKMSLKDRLTWYGPDMSACSFATARLMETWAHAQDVFDTLRVKRINSTRLRHVAHIGMVTFGWSFKVRGMKVPAITPHAELSGPSGEMWVWGKPDVSERIWGSAEEFCLVVTQRRNVADTQLKWQGEHVEKWLSMAQAFAGLSQEPPLPGIRVIDY
jgi:uncharacterized protein (TIGR03084 family)